MGTHRPSIIGVKIYYADGSVHTDWATSPATGVQVVVWLDDQGGGTYAWGIDTYAPPPNASGYTGTKSGSSLAVNKFNSILTQAKTDNGWGR